MTEEKEVLRDLFKDLTDGQKATFRIVFGPVKDVPDGQIPRALRYVRRRKKVNTGEVSSGWWK